MVMGMFRRNNNGEGGEDGNGNNGGFNWRQMMMLPMLFGGFPMGGMYGRFGGGRRRGFGFGRRRYF
eukprot:CAMPEP_0201572264 /NCGR_PEP_ID=MMETSP0190_2-20130828/15425_1 /ASSEMBLY_ACC=CAM_ASM_000263 /TAXON_ID=37353 /ORGANISM="Rosalina sp." /LENGTH=65 /DNA_ID=CAMNT_0047997791 /DNA_START=40 /DNA_END=237 /DNA_ORIENTATION=-